MYIEGAGTIFCWRLWCSMYTFLVHSVNKMGLAVCRFSLRFSRFSSKSTLDSSILERMKTKAE